MFERDFFDGVTKINNLSTGKFGTGFFYSVHVKDYVNDKENQLGNKGIRLLISNKHVLDSPISEIEFELNRQKDREVVYGDVCKLSNREDNEEQRKSVYFKHPDSEIDLACINITGMNINESEYSFKVFEKGFLNKIDYRKISPNSDVFYVGFPVGVYDTKNNLPLLRHGRIASIPEIDYNGKREFVIDAQVFQGSSGSP